MREIRQKAKALEKDGISVDTIRVSLEDDEQTVINAALFQNQELVFSFPDGYKSGIFRKQPFRKHQINITRRPIQDYVLDDWKLAPIDQKILCIRS